MHELNRPTEHLTEDTPCSRLDEIIADYLEAIETNAAPSRASVLAAHPDLANDLIAFFEDQDRLDAVVAPLVGRSSTNGSRSVTAPLQVGKRIGRYELLEELGRGGMGIVYKARQLGANRIVALKMIAAGSWATADELKRFRLECESIAELDHPNIVPLHEVGEEEGRAYYSMKWIEGGSLAGHIERFHDQPRDAVRLLLAVARAVDHAHQHGVLHRDLKPANILLESRTDIPYVSDFGLAKKLVAPEPVNGDRTLPGAPTVSGTALGTPSYMAPEQARNARLATTTADVYSLGAILYECLTGRPPFRASTSLETLLDVLEREPPQPSRIRPGLDRDLDTICLKCLQKEPEKRYASAAAFADDLERYLAGEPILARPVGPGERFLRWCRRQPVVASLSAGVLLSVLAGVGLVFYEWREAEAAREQAESQRADAVSARNQVEIHLAVAENERGKAVVARKETERHLAEAKRERAEADQAYKQAHKIVEQFCLRLSEDQLSQYAALTPLRKQLLQAGLKHLESFRKRMENDPLLRRDLAGTLYGIGQVCGALGSRPEALEAYEKALAAYRSLHADEPTVVEYERRVAQTLTHLAIHQSALANTVEARKSLTESKEILNRLGKRFPKDADVKIGLVVVLNNLRALDGDEGKASDDPTRTGQEVVDLRKKLLEQFPDSEDLQSSLALAWYNLGLTHNSLRRGEDARRCWEEARTLLDRLVDRFGNNPRHRRDLAMTCRHLANWYTTHKKVSEAQRIYEKSRQLLVELTQDFPDVLDYQSQLASTHADIGSALSRQGQLDKALIEMNAALALRKKLVDRQPDDTHLGMALGQSYHNLGNLHRAASKHAESLASFRKGEEAFRKLLKQNANNIAHRNLLAGTLNNMADVLQLLNRSAEGLKVFEECVTLQRMVVDAAPNERAYRESLSMYSRNLSRAYRLEKRHAESVAVTLRQRELWLDNGPELARLLREFQMAANLVGKDSPERRRYIDHGMETLAMALAAGYRDFEHLRTDPDLTLYRQRDEFERLLRTHEMR